ncbi:MAG: hypothetical protein VYA55_18995 [Pseudomonadota bacterium]|nr:hypothetical protein [Pseudomonadota bacterium]
MDRYLNMVSRLRKSMRGAISSLWVLMCLSASVLANDELNLVEPMLAQYGKMNEAEIRLIMASDLPESAQQEIKFGFASEGFVRFMMGMQKWVEHIPKEHYAHAVNASRLSHVRGRYVCASEGLSGYQQSLEAKNPSLVCMWLWSRFLQVGPELSFALEHPLVQGVEPWSNPTPERLDKELSYARLAVEQYNYRFPKQVNEELLQLLYTPGKAHQIKEQLKLIPVEQLEPHFGWVWLQPDYIRRYGRLVCADFMPPLDESDSPWLKRCYAYWYLFLKQKKS